jgi:hypothetical protein
VSAFVVDASTGPGSLLLVVVREATTVTIAITVADDRVIRKPVISVTL